MCFVYYIYTQMSTEKQLISKIKDYLPNEKYNLKNMKLQETFK